MMTDTGSLQGLLPGELADLLAGRGISRFRGEQVFRWLHQHLVDDFQAMTNLPQDLREELANHFNPRLAGLDLVEPASAGNWHFRFSLAGRPVTSLLRCRDYGNSLVLPAFSGEEPVQGVVPQEAHSDALDAGELVSLVQQVAAWLKDRDQSLTHLTLAGPTDPLLNYKAVLRLGEIVHHPLGLGISWRRFSIESLGTEAGLKALCDRQLPVNFRLIVAAPNDYMRSRWSDLAAQQPLTRILPVCQQLFEKTGRRVTIVYPLASGFNDLPEHARELHLLLSSYTFRYRIHLLPAASSVLTSGQVVEPAAPAEIDQFEDQLRQLGFSVTTSHSVAG